MFTFDKFGTGSGREKPRMSQEEVLDLIGDATDNLSEIGIKILDETEKKAIRALVTAYDQNPHLTKQEILALHPRGEEVLAIIFADHGPWSGGSAARAGEPAWKNTPPANDNDQPVIEQKAA